VTITNPTRTLSLKSIESQDIVFDLVVDPNEDVKDINLVLETNNAGVITEMEINKYWLNKPQVSLYKNDFSTLNAINNQNWGLSTKEYFSPPSSITDSPDGNYPDKFKAEFKLAPFSLENAENALLTFYAKWDIENNYDYVQVLASSDNVDFRPLCGKYTNIGTNYQIFGSQLYDGVKSDWVKEEMSLEDFVNQKQVWIKVIIKTDDFSNKDGFYMDDLEIKVTDKINNITDSSNNQFTITPSLVSSDGEVSIQSNKDLSSSRALLYDMNGTLIGIQDIFNGKMMLKPFQLKSGLYIIHLVKDGVMMGVSKIMVQE
jgi:hypothetical protein